MLPARGHRQQLVRRRTDKGLSGRRSDADPDRDLDANRLIHTHIDTDKHTYQHSDRWDCHSNGAPGTLQYD
jgi:hypothetical protein